MRESYGISNFKGRKTVFCGVRIAIFSQLLEHLGPRAFQAMFIAVRDIETIRTCLFCCVMYIMNLTESVKIPHFE